MSERDAIFCKTCLKHGKKKYHNPRVQILLTIKNCKKYSVLSHVKHIKNTQNIAHTSTNCTHHFHLPFYLAHPMTLMAHIFMKWPKVRGFWPICLFAFPIPAILVKVYLWITLSSLNGYWLSLDMESVLSSNFYFFCLCTVGVNFLSNDQHDGHNRRLLYFEKLWLL